MTRRASLERLMKNDEKRFKAQRQKEKEMGIVNSNCHRVPPKEIYIVLQLAEKMRIEIPKSVDDWWANETYLESLENEKSM